MCYVDLNPIRAGIAKTPEESNYTSIKKRIEAHIKKIEPKALFPFVGNYREPQPDGIPFNKVDYLELVDQTARQQRDGKTGFMDQKLSPILQRLGLSTEQWSQACKGFESEFSIFVGGAAAIEKACKVFSKQWVNLQSHRLRLLAD